MRSGDLAACGADAARRGIALPFQGGAQPGKPHRHFQVMTRPYDGKYIDPDAYLSRAERREGSWWPEWQGWLAARSGEKTAPPSMGALDQGYAPLMDAPGSYVMMR